MESPNIFTEKNFKLSCFLLVQIFCTILFNIQYTLYNIYTIYIYILYIMLIFAINLDCFATSMFCAGHSSTTITDVYIYTYIYIYVYIYVHICIRQLLWYHFLIALYLMCTSVIEFCALLLSTYPLSIALTRSLNSLLAGRSSLPRSGWRFGHLSACCLVR